MTTTMQFHEVANIFPMMSDDEYAALKEDIATNGQLQPVYVWQGKIIDGRNRYRACVDLGIVPMVEEWSGVGSLVSFVVSLNLKRRHLKADQLACVAQDILPMLEKEAAERYKATVGRPTNAEKSAQKFAPIIEPALKGEAAEHAAKMVGTNRTYVRQAKQIKEQSPAVFEQVKAGAITLSDAKREIKKTEQAEARAEAVKVAPPAMVREWDGVIVPNTVSLCDVFDLHLPAESVDMIFTDPPYHDEHLRLYHRLAEVAAECLKPGAYCMAYAGKMFLPQIMAALGEHLEYVWTYCVWQPDNNSKISKHNLFEIWRPIVCFKKPGASPVKEWQPDGLQGTRSKAHHEWEQQIEPPLKYIDAYSKAGDLILEPFVGGGTTLAACKQLGRRFIGFDVVADSLAIAAKRVSDG